ncbi:MAG TPA: DUF4129 domain-containing protein [Microthrixaceae bacterium]|nr:DUF4129 domain-containing protein [Microthrixaceae bacterium]
MPLGVCALLLLVSPMGMVSASAGAAGVTVSVPHGVFASASDQQGGTADPAPVDPQQVRDDVRDVMDRPEFDYSPSVLERFFEWIGEQLSKFFQPGEGAGAGASFGGGIGALLGWLLIVAAVVAILVVAYWVISNRTRRSRPAHDDPLSPVEIEHRRRADEWMSDAQRWEASGEWKEALRARYRNLVRVLVDRRQLPDVPGRTTGELRADLDTTTPDARDTFDTCCLLFELAWYADVATGPEENRRFRESADQVLAAVAIDRFDPSTLFDVAGVAREREESPVPVTAASGDGADVGLGS